MKKEALIQVDIKDYPNYIRIRVIGQIRMANIGDLTSVVWDHCEKYTTKAVILDATRLEAIDSTGLATLISFHKKIAPIFIFGLIESIETMMNRVGLNKVFVIHRTKREIRESVEFMNLIK